jgi:hypothetical protein
MPARLPPASARLRVARILLIGLRRAARGRFNASSARLELLRRRGSIEQFGIVRRLNAFEISWRKRRG